MILLVEAAACTGAPPAGDAPPSATPAVSTPAPSMNHPAPSAPALDPVIVTFRVGDSEEFRVRVTDAPTIGTAHMLLAGRPGPSVLDGRLVRGTTDVNTGYLWSIDSGDFRFVEAGSSAACNALPSDVGRDTYRADRYCPSNASVVGIELVR